MKRYTIVHRADDTSIKIAQELRNKFCGKAIEDEKEFSTIFVIGGDGTFLEAVHQNVDRLDKINFIGIHTGTLGFITDYQVEEIDELVHEYLTEEPSIDELKLLEVQYGNQRIYAMNEMRLENPVRTQILDVEIDGVYFETFRGTGMCLATQMGSTAYSRSIKGAVIQHGLPLLQLSEIAGIHHRAYRSLGNSIILKEDSQVLFNSESFKSVVLCYDHCALVLDDIKTIKCALSNKCVRIARYRPYHYLSRLKNLF